MTTKTIFTDHHLRLALLAALHKMTLEARWRDAFERRLKP